MQWIGGSLRSAFLVLALTGVAGTGTATASYPIEARFTAERACPAFQSFRRETNPGDVAVSVGEQYEAVSLNREGGDHVLLEIAEATPSRRWVALTCGRLDTGSMAVTAPVPRPAAPAATLPAATPAAATSAAARATFRPFFDSEDEGAGDPTPEPPNLEPFDRAVLEVCGEWGSRPSRNDFRRMLERPDLTADLQALRDELGESVRGGRLSPGEFADRITALWFAEDGFRHVFCGEPGEERLGGLHYRGRFLQMQERGWGGIAPCRRAEIDPPIHTIGVEYVTPSGQLEFACPKSYSRTLDARALLVEATKAFRARQINRAGEAMCVHRIARPGSRDHQAVLVSRSGAIRTFYPHASPTCDNRRPAENCLCGG